VNVGCIPKKLMHYSAILGESMKDQRECGWALSEQVEHSWEKMLENVTMHIRKLNWGYKSQLSKKKIKYFNAYASFIDSHTIKVQNLPNTNKYLSS
jgi:thioredoxin reductase (NADPH)